MDVISSFFSTNGFMPHGHCYLWQPPLLWTYIVSDLMIAIAYYSIPLALVYFVRKRPDLQFNWIFVMFSVFIFACGTTHLISLWTIWHPDYWADAAMKAVTGIASMVTAVMLWRLMPDALRLPTTRQLEETVERLEQEVEEREQAERSLAAFNDSLETLVQQRTAELEEINRLLKLEIDLRREAEQTLYAEKQRAVVTLQSIGDGVITTDKQSRVNYLNPVAERMTGWSNAEAQGKPLLEVFRIVNESTRKLVPNPVDVVLQHGEIYGLANHTALIGRHGNEYAIEDSAAPIRDQDGNVLGVVLVFHDVSEARNMANKMTYLAEHDYLTGLPNRLLLNDRLHQALTIAKRDQEYIALMFLDLDHFKNINDSLGHEVGDQLLKMVARRLEGCLRASDTISRQGGDEFMILLPELTNYFSPAEVAEKLLAAATVPYEIGAHEITVSASIGIAVFPDDGENGELLTKNADAAMYHAKSLGRNNYQFFTRAMNERVMEIAELESKLRRAVERNEFVLYYQPKIDIRTGQVVGAEALIRWQHPNWGLVAPDRFIPIAEDSGLIRPIGLWVMREACRQNQEWQAAGLARIPVAVNLSTVQLRQHNFLQEVSEILLMSGLAPDYLELEVTESVAIHAETEVINWLHKLRSMGVKLALDDFGTGYSSLSYLKRLPINNVKIDKSFIRDIETDPDDATIITAIIRMSHGLRLNVIAEGVENVNQLEFLKKEGCDQMQGFIASRPIPADEFAQLLQNWPTPS